MITAEEYTLLTQKEMYDDLYLVYDNFIENFSDIIEYIDLLSSADETDLVPEDSIEDYAIRDDSKIEKLQVEDVVKNSSKVENNFFAVTKVIDEE